LKSQRQVFFLAHALRLMVTAEGEKRSKEKQTRLQSRPMVSKKREGSFWGLPSSCLLVVLFSCCCVCCKLVSRVWFELWWSLGLSAVVALLKCSFLSQYDSRRMVQ
jgi:hypothetical protein